MSNIDRYQELINKWLQGSISEAEKVELSQWYNSFPDATKEIPDTYAQDETHLRNRILDKVNKSINVIEKPKSVRPFFTRARWVAASVIFLMLAAISYYTVTKSGLQDEVIGLYDIQPTGNRAKLTLSDGEVINLDEQQSALVVDGGVKYIDGKSVFAQQMHDNEKISYAVLSTPKGGQYRLMLADGTEVWLNASSSIRFPSRFNTNTREVELLSGEAYFSVKKKVDGRGNRVPFFVKSDQQTIEVLGTQFNINMYHVHYGAVTTVAEGSVAVRASKKSQQSREAKVVLTAGKQSIMDRTGTIKEQQVDIEQYTAWKEGMFFFNDANIYTVMEEFGRWYDIDITYEISRSDDLFSGYIPKNVSLGEALGLLKIAGVNFELTTKHNLIVKQKKDR
ncbi:FecR family protein [Sphingobacterium gobiense]|uniref:Anti-sigma factor n=1 Tax=Sphingobacterium gobiense TaxID=1382456 RepID=A0A2S9JV46_9SPHI|nr:FecR domain-containing protein [Sphingobacterium gobiense]PRD57100.1 hypothetical protein C5749_07810 [Sphingobacterium gobiense]